MFDPVKRIRIGITADGRLDLTGNISEPFPMGLDWVRASDYDELREANRLLLRTVNDLLVWRKNPEAFTVDTPKSSDFLGD